MSVKRGFLPSSFDRLRMSGRVTLPHRYPAVGPCFRRGDGNCVAASLAGFGGGLRGLVPVKSGPRLRGGGENGKGWGSPAWVKSGFLNSSFDRLRMSGGKGVTLTPTLSQDVRGGQLRCGGRDWIPAFAGTGFRRVWRWVKWFCAGEEWVSAFAGTRGTGVRIRRGRF